ncbi:nucleotide disphospho-sugar-binding domain-containing protein [Micromonospora sp. CPCC 206061]|uniref:nucleotide disphospho-sugar-binding domain-containing protein n=1 Tax=Micromonospora sp. CPCC 206061 TaxID=3122410 RepID=UPI002FF03183
MTGGSRYVLVTGGSFGDTLPFVGLAKALAAAGAEVLLAAGPEVETLARAERLPQHTLAAARVSDLSLDPRPGRRMATFLGLTLRRVVEPLDQTVTQLAPVLTDRDIVVAHPIQLAAPILARARGLPCVTVSPATWLFRNAERMPLYLPRRSLGTAANRLAWWLFERRLDRRFLPAVRAVWQRCGLPGEPSSFLDLNRSAQRTLLLTSPLFLDSRRLAPAVVATGLASWDTTRMWRNRRPLERFLDDGEPPLVFRAPPHLPTGGFRAAAAEVCRRLGLRSVVIDYSADRVGADGGCYVDRYIPLSVIAPRARAAVHYGGLGTSTAFAAAGVPAVVTPSIVDQFESAEVVAAHGAGVRLDWHRLSARRLESALVRALTLADSASALGTRLRAEDGYRVAAGELLAMAAGAAR